MNNDYKDTIPVRKGEELAPNKLKSFLKKNLNDVPEGELVIEQFGAGHSNLTYLLKTGNWEAVLRRPPLGPVAPKAHDMQREYTILKNLHPVYSTAPKPYIFLMINQLSAVHFLSWSAERASSSIQSFHRKLLTKKSRSEEHTSELQSRFDLVCRLLLEKK